MVLMVGAGARGGLCCCIQNYPKANNKYMKHLNKNKDSLYIMYREI